jgi:hypothetical protein
MRAARLLAAGTYVAIQIGGGASALAQTGAQELAKLGPCVADAAVAGTPFGIEITNTDQYSGFTVVSPMRGGMDRCTADAADKLTGNPSGPACTIMTQLLKCRTKPAPKTP